MADDADVLVAVSSVRVHSLRRTDTTVHGWNVGSRPTDRFIGGYNVAVEVRSPAVTVGMGSTRRLVTVVAERARGFVEQGMAAAVAGTDGAGVFWFSSRSTTGKPRVNANDF